jgi:sorting nexin-1/2
MASDNHAYYAPAAKEFEIDVADPVKQGEGVAAYVSYKVRTKTTHQHYSRPFNEVVRRFRDFSWLHDKLLEKNKGTIVPALPEKSAVQKFQMQTDFIEQRRRALQVGKPAC